MRIIRRNVLRHSAVCRAVLCVASLFVAPLSNGGTKGFTVVMIDVGGQGFFDSKFYKANADGDFLQSNKWHECWESRATGGKSFEMVVKNKIPSGLSREVAQAIWDGDNSGAKKAQKILLRSKAPNGKALDGMYVIDAREGLISVMALGTRGSIGPKNPSRKISVPWNESEPQKGAAEFDLALCSISHPLDFGFAP